MERFHPSDDVSKRGILFQAAILIDLFPAFEEASAESDESQDAGGYPDCRDRVHNGGDMYWAARVV